jgi:hypothetical protein
MLFQRQVSLKHGRVTLMLKYLLTSLVGALALTSSPSVAKIDHTPEGLKAATAGSQAASGPVGSNKIIVAQTADGNGTQKPCW